MMALDWPKFNPTRQQPCKDIYLKASAQGIRRGGEVGQCICGRLPFVAPCLVSLAPVVVNAMRPEQLILREYGYVVLVKEWSRQRRGGVGVLLELLEAERITPSFGSARIYDRAEIANLLP